MKQFVIDANALVSFVTDRNLRQQRKVAELLQKASRLKLEVLCPQNVLTEFVYVMEKVYGVVGSLVNEMIREWIEMPGIRIVHDLGLQMVLHYWPEHLPDYGDAVVAAVCSSHKKAAIVTFDAKFSRKLGQLGLPTADL